MRLHSANQADGHCCAHNAFQQISKALLCVCRHQVHALEFLMRLYTNQKQKENHVFGRYLSVISLGSRSFLKAARRPATRSSNLSGCPG